MVVLDPGGDGRIVQYAATCAVVLEVESNIGLVLASILIDFVVVLLLNTLVLLSCSISIMYRSAAISSRVGRVRYVVISVAYDDEDDDVDDGGRGCQCDGHLG